MAKGTKTKDWEELPEEEILQMRVRDLKLQIPGSAIEPFIHRLYEELNARGIRFHPPCYLADEWLCPDRVPIIGVPFYLAHPRLKHIEQKMMLEVEGGTEEYFMKLLRHECGHALNYAYELYKRTRWRQLFGPITAKYSDSYYYLPYSRRYVIHLKDNYAQAHPDEDFAETFGVWLTPSSVTARAKPRTGSNPPSAGWQKKYADWPVIKKLRYVDGIMEKIGEQTPMTTVKERPPWSASRMTSTLAAYYDRKRKALGSEFHGFYDDSLKELFRTRLSGGATERASALIRRHRRQIINSVVRWTGHRKYDIYHLVSRLILRCEALDLYVGNSQADDIIGVTALLTAIARNTFSVKRRHPPSRSYGGARSRLRVATAEQGRR